MEELDGWCRVASSWPRRRDLDAFERWFEWSYDSEAVDLSEEDLLQEQI